MPIEHPSYLSCFNLTEREQLCDRVTHKRFLELVGLPEMHVHSVGTSVNSFGEYLFVMVSCQTQPNPQALTFWGLGYHEYRERWITDTWQWYESVYKRIQLEVIVKDETIQLIREREQLVTSAATSSPPPSGRAQLYGLLADLTDEDGALNELEELDSLFIDFEDEEDG